MKAFVLVSLNNGVQRRFLNELESYPQVRNVNLIFGEWDVLLQVEFAHADELASFVMDNLRSRKEVKLTSSLIVAE